MIMITGEVRKIVDSSYTNKHSQKVEQSLLIIEPLHGTQNYEITLSSKQLEAGAVKAWEKLKGKQASVMIDLFVNYQYKFTKYNAVGDALPMKAVELEVVS